MSDHKTYIGCPECCSFASFDSPDDAEDSLSDHNESMHDGEDVAHTIEPDSEDSVNEFVDEAREQAPQKQYEELISDITRGNTPYTVATIGEH